MRQILEKAYGNFSPVYYENYTNENFTTPPFEIKTTATGGIDLSSGLWKGQQIVSGCIVAINSNSTYEKNKADCSGLETISTPFKTSTAKNCQKTCNNTNGCMGYSLTGSTCSLFSETCPSTTKNQNTFYQAPSITLPNYQNTDGEGMIMHLINKSNIPIKVIGNGKSTDLNEILYGTMMVILTTNNWYVMNTRGNENSGYPVENVSKLIANNITFSDDGKRLFYMNATESKNGAPMFGISTYPNLSNINNKETVYGGDNLLKLYGKGKDVMHVYSTDDNGNTFYSGFNNDQNVFANDVFLGDFKYPPT